MHNFWPKPFCPLIRDQRVLLHNRLPLWVIKRSVYFYDTYDSDSDSVYTREFIFNVLIKSPSINKAYKPSTSVLRILTITNLKSFITEEGFELSYKKVFYFKSRKKNMQLQVRNAFWGGFEVYSVQALNLVTISCPVEFNMLRVELFTISQSENKLCIPYQSICADVFVCELSYECFLWHKD